MNIETVVYPGIVNGTSFTVFADTDVSCTIALVTVTSGGCSDITTTNDGWSRLEQVNTRHGPRTAPPGVATSAVFQKTNPGTDETLTVSLSPTTDGITGTTPSSVGASAILVKLTDE